MIYEIKLDKDQLLIVSDALGAMPYLRVVRVILEIQKQITAQEQLAAEARQQTSTAG